jgi:hypothetical protein
MSVPKGLPTDEELDELERIREQLTRRFATANGRRLRGVMVSFMHDEVELIFEGLEGEVGELMLTISLAEYPNVFVGGIDLAVANSLDFDEDYAEERRTPLDEKGVYE